MCQRHPVYPGGDWSPVAMDRPAQVGAPAGRHRRGASELLFLFSNHYGAPDQCGSDVASLPQGCYGLRGSPVDEPKNELIGGTFLLAESAPCTISASLFGKRAMKDMRPKPNRLRSGRGWHGFYAWRGKQGRYDRVGNLILDDIGRFIPRRMNDHLHVGDIGQGIERHPALRPDTGQHQQKRSGEDEEAIGRTNRSSGRSSTGPLPRSRRTVSGRWSDQPWLPAR
jgi:hypothetical protein